MFTSECCESVISPEAFLSGMLAHDQDRGWIIYRCPLCEVNFSKKASSGEVVFEKKGSDQLSELVSESTVNIEGFEIKENRVGVVVSLSGAVKVLRHC